VTTVLEGEAIGRLGSLIGEAFDPNDLEFLLKEQASTRCSVVTPSDAERRGAQISIRIPVNGQGLCKELANSGIVGDWRQPDTFRVAPVPLYNSYRDVFRFVQKFAAALS